MICILKYSKLNLEKFFPGNAQYCCMHVGVSISLAKKKIIYRILDGRVSQKKTLTFSQKKIKIKM